MSDVIKARRVAEKDRLDFLPRYFTPRWMLHGESLVYAWMRRLSPGLSGGYLLGYQGGYWEFYTLSNSGFYLAPTGQEMRLIVEGNYFDEVVSADAAGIIATLFALNDLACDARPGATGSSLFTTRCWTSRVNIQKKDRSCRPLTERPQSFSGPAYQPGRY